MHWKGEFVCVYLTESHYLLSEKEMRSEYPVRPSTSLSLSLYVSVSLSLSLSLSDSVRMIKSKSVNDFYLGQILIQSVLIISDPNF